MDEKEFQELLKKMFSDYEKGLTDNDSLIAALSDKVKGLLGDQLSDVDTLKKNIETLTSEIKNMRLLSIDPVKVPSKLYKGVWGDAALARDFGLYVLASVSPPDTAKAATDLLAAKGYKLERAMNAQDNTEGGLLAPTQFIDTLIMLIESYGKFRANVNAYPMASDSAVAPMLTNLLNVYCPAAGVTPTESNPGFKPVGLNAKEWVTYCAIDRSLNEDAAIAVGNLVGELIALAFALKEDEVGFLGDGTEQYFNHTGIIGALTKTADLAGLVTGSGTTWSDLTLEDFNSLVGTVPDYADDGINLKWYCSRKFYFSVMRKLALNAGGTDAEEIHKGDKSGNRTFLGYEVEFVHVMPKATAVNTICCIFGNLRRGAWLGDRRQMTIEESKEALFAQRQIAIMGTQRVAPTVFGVGDTENSGPICALKTAAT